MTSDQTGIEELIKVTPMRHHLKIPYCAKHANLPSFSLKQRPQNSSIIIDLQVDCFIWFCYHGIQTPNIAGYQTDNQHRTTVSSRLSGIPGATTIHAG